MDELRSQDRDTTLLIVDHLDERAFSGLDETTSITVLPLGLMPALYKSKLSEPVKRLSATIFPIEEVAERAMSRVRLLYPDFVRELARQPIGDGPSLLQLLGSDDGSLWWFTDTAEKSPLRTPFINQLYHLTLIDQALSRCAWSKIRLSVRDRVLRECIELGIKKRGIPFEVGKLSPAAVVSIVKSWFWLRFFVQRLMMAVQSLGNLLVLAAIRIGKPPRDRSPAAVIYSRYPTLYADAFSRPIERNLEHLLESLRGYGEVWQVVLLNLWPWQLLRRSSEVRDAFSQAHIVPLLLFASLRELFVSFSGVTLLAPLWKYRRLRARLAARFDEWDVSPAWQAEVDRSLTGAELSINQIISPAMRRLAQVYRPRVVIHPAEFQPMERAIWAGLKGTETRAVALQHTTVSSNTLMYFFAEDEIPEALSGADRLATPLPDYYLTTGDWPLEIMRDAGYPVSRSAVVGAVRYNELRAEGLNETEKVSIRNSLALPANERIVLVTTSSDRADTMALLESLREAITLLPTSVTFLFKAHYHCRVEAEVESLFAAYPCRVVDVDADLHSYLRASDAVLVTNSTTGLEAIALGCPPVVFDNCAILNIGPLGDLRDAALFAVTPEGLAEAIEVALDPEAVRALRFAWPRALARTFHVLDGLADQRFVNFLNEKQLLPASASQSPPQIALSQLSSRTR